MALTLRLSAAPCRQSAQGLCFAASFTLACPTMPICVFSLLSLILSLATLCAAAPLVRADDGGAVNFGVSTSETAVASAPSADTTTAVAVNVPAPAPTTAPPDSPDSSTASTTTTGVDAVALSFNPTPVAALPTDTTVVATRTDATAPDLFAGGSDSLVARTVGHAEGTRTADGSKTRAYYGHSDPGNGVWNLGSFSYQHAASSPEDADDKQLQRLKRQRDALRQKAAAARLQFSREEELNAIDLANQAPLAALDTPGYVEWLKQAHKRGLTGSEAVLWARTQSYWNPRRQRWEAPGLGNTEDSISHDQNRRQTAIARALETYEQQAQARQKDTEPSVKVANKPPQETTADQIIFQNLSPPRSKNVAVVP